MYSLFFKMFYLKVVSFVDAFLQGFSIFIGLGIHNCMMYERALKLNARQKVALEVLAYHASSTIEETVDFMVIRI